MGKVLENQQKVSKLEVANKQAQDKLNETKATINSLQQNLSELKCELVDLQKEKSQNDIGRLNQDGPPVGFGFDGQNVIPVNPDQGT